MRTDRFVRTPEQAGERGIERAARGPLLTKESALELVVEHIRRETQKGRPITKVPCPDKKTWDALSAGYNPKITPWVTLALCGYPSREDAFETARNMLMK